MIVAFAFGWASWDPLCQPLRCLKVAVDPRSSIFSSILLLRSLTHHLKDFILRNVISIVIFSFPRLLRPSLNRRNGIVQSSRVALLSRFFDREIQGHVRLLRPRSSPLTLKYNEITSSLFLGFTPLTEKMNQLGQKGIDLMATTLNSFFDKILSPLLFLRLLQLFNGK